MVVMRLLRLTDPPRPADAADALALAICHSGGAAPRPGWPRPRPAPAGKKPMIAHLDGTVAAVAPDGAVIDVGGVGLLVQCTPGHAGRAADGGAGQGGHLTGRPRGRADPVRVRLR